MNRSLVLALGVSVALSSVSFGHQKKSPADFVGKKAPGISVKTIDGKSISNASFKGKVVVLDFWATWCTNCIKASPTMQKLHETYPDLVVVGMNAMERKPRPASSVDYKAKHGYTYEFVANADAAHKAFKGVGLPLIVVIDKKGVVRSVFDDFVPETTPAQLEAAIKSAQG